jgi:hypothetical protein
MVEFMQSNVLLHMGRQGPAAVLWAVTTRLAAPAAGPARIATATLVALPAALATPILMFGN